MHRSLNFYQGKRDDIFRMSNGIYFTEYRSTLGRSNLHSLFTAMVSNVGAHPRWSKFDARQQGFMLKNVVLSCKKSRIYYIRLTYLH